MLEQFLFFLIPLLTVQPVSQLQVRIEMGIGGIVGGVFVMLYYVRKYQSGHWESKDGKNAGMTILAVVMFVGIVLVV